MKSYRNSDPRPPIMVGSPPGLVPPRMDWDRAPWNRWSFQHVREVLPTVEVWRGDGPSRDFARHEHDLDGLEVAGLDGQPTTLAALHDDTDTDGFLVLKDGAIVYERYFNAMQPRTLHLSQSVAKSITGCVTGILISRGLLDPAVPVTEYLPELKATAWRGATLQHILDMTSGTRFGEDYDDPRSEMGKLDFSSGWKPMPPGIDENWPADVWSQILTLREQDRPHGEAFVYRSIETDVLAFAMERVTGRRLAQLVSEEIWQKLGAEESACFTVDPAGYALADGGFNACLRDYARFGQMILEGGGGIVPIAWIEAARTPNGADFGDENRAVLPDGGYRNQFWIEDRAKRNLMCRGVFGQLIHVGFDTGTVTVKLASRPEASNEKHLVASLEAIRAVARALA